MCPTSCTTCIKKREKKGEKGPSFGYKEKAVREEGRRKRRYRFNLTERKEKKEACVIFKGKAYSPQKKTAPIKMREGRALFHRFPTEGEEKGGGKGKRALSL